MCLVHALRLCTRQRQARELGHRLKPGRRWANTVVRAGAELVPLAALPRAPLCKGAAHEEILHGTQGHRKSSWIRGVLGPNPRKKGLQREKSSDVAQRGRGYMHSSVPGTEKSQEIPRPEGSGHLEATSQVQPGRKAPGRGYLEHGVARQTCLARGSAPTPSDLPYPYSYKGVSICLSSQQRP